MFKRKILPLICFFAIGMNYFTYVCEERDFRRAVLSTIVWAILLFYNEVRRSR